MIEWKNCCLLRKNRVSTLTSFSKSLLFSRCDSCSGHNSVLWIQNLCHLRIRFYESISETYVLVTQTQTQVTPTKIQCQCRLCWLWASICLQRLLITTSPPLFSSYPPLPAVSGGYKNIVKNSQWRVENFFKINFLEPLNFD